ncbi:hypothetical protein NEF87_000436 [Candidatus Lokiarchaeum ossiferum]|uniref:LTD domain-containing protein n=1 Tax=Candidatus Lokiarchaeum ossiferum TaxID=2951803 RepID=A0ABY6HL50_9ARCH|nr:hypothetical protein NEF87_000436 [Candidatus Lokiarchaeum sp. B-35]
MKKKMLIKTINWKKLSVFLSSVILAILILNILPSLTSSTLEDGITTDETVIYSQSGNLSDLKEPISSENEKWSQATTLYDQAEEFFDDSYVHEIKLYFDDEEGWYDELLDAHANDPDDPYFSAKFVYDDIEIDPIGINFKGHSSFMGESYKKSFRIDFNYYDSDAEFYGLQKLNLNNGHMDPTMLREKIFWDFASNYVSTVRCVFTRVYVNDEYFGLYTAIEQIDDEFIESRYGSKEGGNLYRAETAGTLSYLGEAESLYASSYELKTNENENDFSKLISLTKILENTPVEDFEEEIEKVLDVEDTLYCMALLNIFASLDSFIGSAHNFYLYENEETGLINYILWDANEAFGRFTFGLEEGQDVRLIDPFWTPTSSSMGVMAASESLTDESTSTIDGPAPPEGPPPIGPDGPGNEFSQLGTDRPLFERLMEVESYNHTYLRILAEMIRDGFNIEFMEGEIQELADLIREDIYADPYKVYTNEQFELTLTDGYSNQKNIFGLESFIEIRSTYLNETLDAYAKKMDIQLNEISLDNGGIIADEKGDYDPWIEIYNLGPGQVNLDHLYLTDDVNNPDKWAFPNFTLDDGEFYLIWADVELTEGSNHLSFELLEEGGEVFLYVESAEGNFRLLDEITYPPKIQNSSYGRYPDGDGEWQDFGDYPTPNHANQENDLIVKLPTTLFINEFMAENQNTIEDPDDDGNYADWIELYNSGNQSIDLSGMYLTDFILDPTLWVFPEGSIIEAMSFLVVWADNEPEQGELHTNFKLSGNGEEIGLISNDGSTLIDYIQFVESIQDFSMGRIPDGSDIWDYSISTPTPGEENSELEVEDTTTIETGFFYIFVGGLASLTIGINLFHKKMRLKNNGDFWISPQDLRNPSPKDGQTGIRTTGGN